MPPGEFRKTGRPPHKNAPTWSTAPTDVGVILRNHLDILYYYVKIPMLTKPGTGFCSGRGMVNVGESRENGQQR